jgi:hypothetical protein
MPQTVTTPPTFLPLSQALPDLASRIQTELGAAVPAVGAIQQLLAASLPSPLPSATSGTPPPDLGVFDVIGLRDLSVRIQDQRLSIDATFVVAPGYEPKLPVPGISQLTFVIEKLGSAHVEVDAQGAALELRGPSIGLRFDRSWLRPAAARDSSAAAEIEILDLGYFSIDHKGNVDFGVVPGGTLRFVTDNDPWVIGDTGVTLETGELDVILREGPEGGPGVTLSQARLRFNDDLAAKDGSGFAVVLEDARITRTGFSGSASLVFADTAVDNAANPTHFTGSGAASLFGFEFGVNSIELDFKDNLPVGSSVKGGMILPYFEQAVGCTLALARDGSFDIAFTGLGQDGLLTLTRPGLLELKAREFELSRSSQGVTTLVLGGSLALLAQPSQVGGTLPRFTIDHFSIDSRGEVSLRGGWIDLEPAAHIDLIGFVLTIERLGMGFDPTQIWVGVTGGIALVDALPRGTVDELRLIFPTQGGSPSIALKGASIDAHVGGQVALMGAFGLIDDPTVKGFHGDISLAVLSAGFALDGSLLAGIDTAAHYAFLYVYVHVELPVGIPLPPTPVSLFGFAGLFGLNVSPSRKSGQNWYYDWYEGPPQPGATQSTKWTAARDAFALGAGLTLGTSDGYTVVARALLVITLPHFLLLIEGRGGLLTQRAELSDKPPLRALVVLDPTDSILFALEAQYEFVANVLFAHGVVEGYFPFTSGAWHVYLGEKPEDRRIVADILKRLFRADAYVMIDSTRTQFGGRIGYVLDKRFGPLAVTVRAVLSGEGVVSHHPQQLAAHLDLTGKLAISAFGVGISIALDAGIAVRVPTPFLLSLHFSGKLSLPWPLPSPSFSFDVKFEEQVPPPYPGPLLTDGTAQASIGSATIALAAGSNTSGVPLDGRLALTFAHAISPADGVSFPRLLNFVQAIYHQVSPEYSFRYALDSLTLERLDGSGAAVETFDLSTSSTPLYGSWQLTPGNADSNPAPTTSSSSPGGSIFLVSKTPFPWLDQTTGNGTAIVGQSAGTDPVVPLPTYQAAPATPPPTRQVDPCSILTGGDGWLPGDGETANGEPDPALPTQTVTPEGTVVVVSGFPQVTPGSAGQPAHLIDPTGSPFGFGLHFPNPVVVTGVAVDPGPGGTVTVTNQGTPAQPPNPVTTPPVTTPGTPPGTRPGPTLSWRCWLCVLLAALATVLALGLAMAYAAGLFEPFLPRTWWVAILLLLVLAILLAIGWWWACACCRCRPWLLLRRRGPAARAMVQRQVRASAANERAATAVLRRLAATPERAAGVPGAGAGAPSAIARGAVLPAAGAVAVPARSAAAPSASGGGSVPAPVASGVVADQVTITSSDLTCGPITWVGASAQQAYAEAQAANAQRAQQASNYAASAWQTLTEEAFLFRRDSRYRINLQLTKIGKGQEVEQETQTIDFTTQPTGPSDLRPYVLYPAPTGEDLPLFRAEEIGVRFLESYVRALWVRAAAATLTIEIRDTTGAVQPGRATSWGKAETHIDRTGELALINGINQIYGTLFSPHDVPADDVLVCAPEPTHGGAALPAQTSFEAAVTAAGPSAPPDPLYRFRFRTGRYADLTDWARALSPTVTTIPDPGLAPALWAATGPIPIGEPALLPLVKQAPPARPALRRIDRGAASPILILTLAEPLPWRRVAFGLRHAGTAGSSTVVAARHAVAYGGEHIVPLVRYKGTPAPNEKGSALSRLVRDLLETIAPELAQVDDAGKLAGTGANVPLSAVWVEDGSRALLVPTDPAERFDDPAGYLFEVRYLHQLPDATGHRVIDTAIVTLRFS